MDCSSVLLYTAARVGVPGVPSLALHSPFAPAARRRSFPKSRLGCGDLGIWGFGIWVLGFLMFGLSCWLVDFGWRYLCDACHQQACTGKSWCDAATYATNAAAAVNTAAGQGKVKAK